MIKCDSFNNNGWKFIDKEKKTQVIPYPRKKNPIKCGAIIFNSKLTEVILVQNKYLYQNGEIKFGLPKGHKERNESFSQCAQREIYEETGLTINIADNMDKIKINNTYYYPIVLENDVKIIRISFSNVTKR